MNKMTRTTGLCVKLVSAPICEFETIETSATYGKSMQGQLGSRLRKVFTLPGPDSTPASVERLLRELDKKVG
jgi:hypothetical protein